MKSREKEGGLSPRPHSIWEKSGQGRMELLWSNFLAEENRVIYCSLSRNQRQRESTASLGVQGRDGAGSGAERVNAEVAENCGWSSSPFGGRL